MCAGITVRSVVPSAWMRSFTDCCAPRPSATMAMTAATPITMPSMVRNERSLLAPRASRATPMVSPSSMSAPSSRRPGPARGPRAARRRHPRHAAADPLAEAVLVLRALRLHLGHAQQGDLVALLQAVEDLGVVEVAHAEAHHARLEPVRRLHEHDLGIARAHGTARAVGPVGAEAAATRRSPARAARRRRAARPGRVPRGALALAPRSALAAARRPVRA